MIVRGLTAKQLESIAGKMLIDLCNIRPQGKGVAFTLKPRYHSECRFYRRGRSGQRIASVCWHGHRDFMRGIFRLNPDAQVVTCKANYKGAEDFESKYVDTGTQNIGSMMFPLWYAEACDCGEGAR